MAKKPPDAEGAPDAPSPPEGPDPLTDGGDAPDPDYPSHLKVPLPFMERLEVVAKRINNRRRRAGKKKRALGWFVATHLNDWLTQAEALLDELDRQEQKQG